MNFVKVACRCTLLNEQIFHATRNQMRCFYMPQSLLSSKKAERTKGSSSEVIRLYDQSGNVIGNKTKQEAETIAKKNGFVLQQMEIVGKPKFVEYQLISRHDDSIIFDAREKSENSNEATTESTKENSKESQKSEKTSKEQSKPRIVDVKRILFDFSIAPADLKVKIDQINSWILRGKQVQLTIQGISSSMMDSFSEKISQQFVAQTRILQKKQKGNSLKIFLDKDPKSVSTEAEDLTVENDHDSVSDEFVIDPDLLGNDVELEKILKNKKK